LSFDRDYAAGGIRTTGDGARVRSIERNSDDGETAKLKEELHRLQLRLTSKEQDLMELRSKITK